MSEFRQINVGTLLLLPEVSVKIIVDHYFQNSTTLVQSSVILMPFFMTTDFESITHQWKIYGLDSWTQLVSIHMALTIVGPESTGKDLYGSLHHTFYLQVYNCEVNCWKLHWDQRYQKWYHFGLPFSRCCRISELMYSSVNDASIEIFENG